MLKHPTITTPNKTTYPKINRNTFFAKNLSGLINLIIVCTIGLLIGLAIVPARPARADAPPGIQEYYVFGNEYHVYRMYIHGGVPSIPGIAANNAYMASVVDITVTADGQIIFYDHWEDGYEADIFNPTVIDPVAGTLVLGDGNPANGSAADFIPGRSEDVLEAGDSIALASRYPYNPGTVGATSPINGYIPLNNAQHTDDHRFDSGDRIVSTGGAIGLVHVMWPVEYNSGTDFDDLTWMGDSWEIYSNQVLKTALQYTTPVGEDMGQSPLNLLQFKNVSLQIQAFENNTTVTIDNGIDPPTTVQLNRGQTYYSGDNVSGSDQGYIDETVNGNGVDVLAGTKIVADKPVQAGLVAYVYSSSPTNGFQDRYYNMIPETLWDKFYFMPTSDNPSPGATSQGHSQIYIYNPNDFTISVSSADVNGVNPPFNVPAKSVVTYEDATGASNFQEAVPTLSGVSLSSEAHFWAFHAADADPNDGVTYDWGNTFLPLFFLTNEYYVSWSPGNAELPPTGANNGSPIWVTTVEDNTHINVDFDNDEVVDESFWLDALEVVRLFDDSDHDQSGTHIWAENGQKLAVIWGEDAATANISSPYLDVGHLVLPTDQEWLASVYNFDKNASPEVLAKEGGTVLFSLKATAASYADVENLVFTDTLPNSWTYVTGSTVINYPDGTIQTVEPIASTITASGVGNTVITRTQLSWGLGADLNPGQAVELQFQANLDNTAGNIGPRHYDGFENGYNAAGPWLSDWTEENDDNNAGGGNIRVVGSENGVAPYNNSNQLRLRGNGISSEPAIYRAVDLSQFTRPVLRLKRFLYSLESNDSFGAEVSTDNGNTYTQLLTWEESDGENVWQQEEIDLTPFVANAVRVRFVVFNPTGTGDYLYLDDIEIYDSFVLHTNQATAKGQYLGFDYVTQDQQNIYIAPFEITQETSAQSIALGSTIVFTFTYRNSSDSITGSDFIIQDTLPPGLIFVDASNGGQYDSDTNTIYWDIGDLPPNTQGTVVLTARLVDTVRPQNGELLDNAANLTNGEYFIRSNVIHLTALAPDLQATKTAPGSAHPGDVMTYTIEYQNVGSIPAIQVVITDTVPNHTTYQSSSCTGSCSVNGSTITWDLGDIPAGGSGSVSFQVEISQAVPLGTNIQNIAQVKHHALAAPELIAANTRVNEVKISKTVDKTLAGPGQVLTFTLTYETIANSTAAVYDAIPDYTTYVAGSATSQSGVITPYYSTDGGSTYSPTEPGSPATVTDLKWEVKLISGTTEAVSFQAQVDVDLNNQVTIENQASMASPLLIEAIPSNEVSVETVKLTGSLQGPEVVAAGDTFTYTLRFSNNGSGDATVTINDILPDDVTFIKANPTPSSSPDPVTWAVIIPAGATNVEYTIQVEVPADTPDGTELKNQLALISEPQSVFDEWYTYVGSSLIGQKYATDLNGPPLLVADTIRYDIVVTNTSTVYTHTNVTIYDTLPVSVTHVSSSISPVGTINYLPGDHAVLATVPEIGPQEVVIATIEVTLDADTLGQSITNTGVITSNESPLTPPVDPVCPDGSRPDGNGNCPSTPVLSTTLTLTKEAEDLNGAPIIVGDTIRYTLRVTNSNIYTAFNVVVVDTLPLSVTLVSTSTTGGTYAGPAIGATGLVTWTVGDMAPGANETMLITVTLNPDTAGQAITNTGTVTGDNVPDPPEPPVVCPDGSAPPCSTVVSTTTLTISKSAQDLNGPPLVVSDTIRYTIVVTNNTPNPAYNVTITDDLPDQVTCQSVDGDLANCADPLVWTVSQIDGNDTYTLEIEATINEGTEGQTITNTATVTASNVTNPPDPTEPICPDGSPEPCDPVVSDTNLSITKTAQDLNGPPLVVSDTIRYTILVTNTGLYTAYNVTIIDNLPSQVTCQSVDGDPANCADPLVWTISQIGSSDTYTLEIEATINEGTEGQTITNTATVTASNVTNPPDPTEPICPDGSPEPCDPVVSNTNLSITKTAQDLNGPPLVVSDTIRYTILVTNNTPNPAYNVTITDDLPDQVTCQSVDGDLANCADPLVWTISQIDGNDTYTLEIEATVNEGTEGQTITNTAMVTASNVINPPDPTDPVCPDGSPVNPDDGTCETTPGPSPAPDEPPDIYLPIIFKQQ